MSDFETELGFQDCWTWPKRPRSVRSPAASYFSTKPKQTQSGEGRAPTKISSADKARLARVVSRAPEVMVKVSKPAKMDKSGNVIHVTRQTESVRVGQHIDYISRNGKLELETDEGAILSGKEATARLYHEWMQNHDEDRANRLATDRTRITTSIVFSMPEGTNANAVKDAVRSLAKNEFGGRHDYVMALHTDTKRPHVHLTVRTVGHDGVKLNLRKADLQHLRDSFAARLRQRGIEAESTPRYARGVTRKGHKTPVYKMRQRGATPSIDKAKRKEVSRELADNNGRLPSHVWDHAIVARRNRVMNTYGAAAAILAESPDPADRALARDVEAFSRSLTGVETERATIARQMSREHPERAFGGTRGAQEQADRSRTDKEKRPTQERGPSRER